MKPQVHFQGFQDLSCHTDPSRPRCSGVKDCPSEMTKAFVLEWHIPVDKPLLEGDTFDRWSEEEVEEGCRFKVRQKGSLAFFKNSCCHHHSPSSTAHSQLFINCIIIVMVVQGVPKKALSKLPFCETGFEGTWPSTIHCQLSSQLALEGHIPSNPISQNGNSESVFFFGTSCM